MIDDYPKAMALLRKMEAQLPIPARPTAELVSAMRKHHGVRLARDYALQIKSVLYAGDEGGIMCDVTPPGMNPTLCSLTHISVDSGHLLADEIRAYQEARSNKLAGSHQSRKPTSFALRPRKKHRR